MKYNTIISILRNIKPTQTNTPHMPLTKSIDAHISQLPILKTINNTYCQEKLLPDLLEIYLSALNYSLAYIASLPESATEVPQNFHNSDSIDGSSKINQYLIYSPYHDLFFFNNHNKHEISENDKDIDADDTQVDENAKTDDSISADLNNTPSIEMSYSAPLIKNRICHTFPDALYPFAYALRRSISACPYSMNPQLRSSRYRKNTNTLDKRKKELAETDIPANSSITLSEIKKGNHFINIFNEPLIKALLTIGGPFSVSYFDHIYDISSQNDNIQDSQTIVSFFRKTYKYTIQSLKDADNPKHLFTLFTLETAFNGSFLLYFCDFFSGNTTSNIRKSLFPVPEGKHKPANKNSLFLLYEHLNCIENPFIKHMLLDEIIRSTYYNDYFYDNCDRPAGKSNISQWCNDICNYSDSIAKMECRLYKTYLSYSSTNPLPKEKIIEKYYNMFQTSNLYYKKGTPKSSRSLTFKNLLPKIAEINYQYYPLDKHPLFCPDENIRDNFD